MSELKNQAIKSVCPICLKRILGKKYIKDNKIYLHKECPDHGVFEVLLDTNAEHYTLMEKIFNVNRKKAKNFLTTSDKGCPYDCGLCNKHTQDTCLSIIEVTNKCNLSCKNCFASANDYKSEDPSLEQIKSMYQTVLNCQNNPTCVQISGGEPTLRDDLPDIISLGKKMGIDHIELNTNGIRISKDIDFFKKIIESGINAIYLSFDGISDEIYIKRCGIKLFDIKKKVIDICHQYNIGVVLVPLVSKEYNLENIGKIIQFAKENVPTVRGVHFQPVFSSGRSNINNNNYVTIYDLIKEIEYQTNKELKIENFTPSLMPNAHCGVTCLCLVNEKKLIPLTNVSNSLNQIKQQEIDVASRTKKSVINRWKNQSKEGSFEIPVISSCCNTKAVFNSNSLSWLDFVNLNENNYLTISIMSFQDSMNYEIDRVKNCCIHVVTKDNFMIPFCNYNLSSINNEKCLYRTKKNY